VGAIARPAHGLPPLVNPRTGRLVEVQHRGAVQARTDPIRAHRDHPAVISVGVDHGPAVTASTASAEVESSLFRTAAYGAVA
jgi:hypothetical protein